jgi:hypothetical protein
VQISIGLSPANPATPKGAFSPASIGNLQLWLDASDASTLFQNSNGTTAASADGDPVGYWGDKSGNSNHCLQTDGTKKPLLKTSIQNSKNVVRNDGVNDFLKSLTGGNDQSYTIFCVNIKRGTGRHMMVFSTGEEVTGKRRCLWHYDNSRMAFNGLNRDFSSTFSWDIDVANVAQIKNNLTTPIIQKNELTPQQGTVTLVSHIATNIFIGSNNATTENYQGDYCEVVYYSGLISDDNKTLLLLYLNTKWGVY